MIHSLKLLQEPSDTSLKYLKEESRNRQIEKLYRRLEEGIEFKDGINIIIGENGSGKSTILNIMRKLLYCEHSFKSEEPMYFSDWEDMAKLGECFELKNDYRKTTFNLYNMRFDKDAYCSGSDIIMKDPSALFQFQAISEESRGQNVMGDLSQLFNIMFNPKKQPENFPLAYYVQNLIKGKKFANDNWMQNIKKVGKYIKRDTVEDNSYTILMDEPDSGLDIANLKEIYSVLSVPKEQTQIIAVVHNPMIIHKLNKLDFVNIISLTNDYANIIDSFLED